jgi:hypothetical protein
MSFAFSTKKFPGILARETSPAICLAMSENHGINPFAAAHAVPIERAQLEHFLPNHQPAAAMAAIDSRPFLDDRRLQDSDHCDSPPLVRIFVCSFVRAVFFEKDSYRLALFQRHAKQSVVCSRS